MPWSQKFKLDFLNLPNLISMIRGFIGCLVAILLHSPHPISHLVAFVLFIVGAISDYFDGVIARRYRLTSDFGKILDPTADKILILAPLLIFARSGFFSVWWVFIIVYREVLVTFCRIGWMLEGVSIGTEKIGKLKFGLQVSAVIVAFLYDIERHFSMTFLQAPFLFLMRWLLVLAGILTLVSGITFFLSNVRHFKTPAFAKYVAAAGVGLLPGIPGTYGSLVGLGMIWLTWDWASLYALNFVLALAAGRWACRRIDLREDKDPSYFVLDEVIGMMVAFIGIPIHVSTSIFGFVLFRFFDIVKPYPLRRLEKLPGFWGILLDDIGAGFYTWLVLFFLWK